MITLLNLTDKDLSLLIEGLKLAHDYREEIDEQYELTFKVVDMGHYFVAKYDWFKGIEVRQSDSNPAYATDPKKIVESDFFKIFKTESLNKLTKEVISAIEQVTKYEFDNNLETISHD